MAPPMTLADIFNRAQESFHVHKKCVQQMKLLRGKVDGFEETFIRHVNQILLVFRRELAVERLIRFVLDYVSHAVGDGAPDNDFICTLLAYFSELTRAKEKSVRFRACQFISGLLSCLGDDAEIQAELWEAVEDSLITRLRDRVPIVRVQAVQGLARLQDPSAENDAVTQKYIRLLGSDSSKDVRKAVLSHIGISRLTLDHILRRTRDVNDDVRKHAFHVAAHKINIKSLCIESRASLLRSGLKERNPSVRKSCVDMIHKFWLKTYDQSVVSLLSALDPEEYEEESVLMLNGIFERVAPQDRVSLDKLTSEQALFLRVYYEFLQKQDSPMEEEMEFLVPDLASFCQALKKYSDDSFICRQLLRVGLVVDLSDESGRRELSALLRNMISSINQPEENLILMTEILSKLHEGDDLVNVILEVVSDVREALLSDNAAEDYIERTAKGNEIEALEKKLSGLEIEKDKAVVDEDFSTAASIKKEMDGIYRNMGQLNTYVNEISEREDALWLHCLNLSCALLQYCRKLPPHGGLATLLENVVLPGIQQSNIGVRGAAVKALGLFCVLDKEKTTKFILLFMQILENDVPDIQLIVVKTLFDLMMLYESDAFEFKPSGDEPSTVMLTHDINYSAVVERLSSYLQHEDGDLRTASVEGFAKLFFVNRIKDLNILKTLFLLYFNPTTEDDVRLRQCLSVFFPAYAFSSLQHELNVKEVFIPSLRILGRAPTSSPLHKINTFQFATFLVHLMDVRELPERMKEALSEQMVTPHEELAVELVNEALLSPDSSECKLCVRIMNTLTFDRKNVDVVKNMLYLVDRLLDDAKDRVLLRQVSKLRDFLQELDIEPDRELKHNDVKRIEASVEEHRAAWLAETERLCSVKTESVRTRTTRGTKRKQKKKAVVEDESPDESEETEVIPKTPVEKRTLPARRARVAGRMYKEESEDEQLDSEGSDEELEEKPKPKKQKKKVTKEKPAKRKTVGRKKLLEEAEPEVYDKETIDALLSESDSDEGTEDGKKVTLEDIDSLLSP